MFVFVSDVHLTKPHTKKYGVFLNLLENCLHDQNLKELFLVGDVFDLWLGHKPFFLKEHEKLIRLVESIAKVKKVHIFEGNHDFHFHKKWWAKKGITVHKENYEFKASDKNWYICHGDLLNKNDLGYRSLRWFFRSLFVQGLIKILPGKLIYKIGTSLSSTESKATQVYHKKQSFEGFKKRWRSWLTDFFKEHPSVDVFICGHYHVRLHDFMGKRETLNLGSWLGDEGYKYLHYDGERFSFKLVQF